MNRNRFEELLTDLQSVELSINRTKGVEYAGEDDALANFKRIASLIGIDPRLVCVVYMTKHYLSIVNHGTVGTLSNESLRDRVADLRLYAALYLALDEESRVEDMPGADTVEVRAVDMSKTLEGMRWELHKLIEENPGDKDYWLHVFAWALEHKLMSGDSIVSSLQQALLAIER